MHELGVHKQMVGLNVERELDRKVLRKFAKPGDAGKTVAYVRALEESVRGVLLTLDDYREIEEEIKIAMEKRLEKRRKRKGT